MDSEKDSKMNITSENGSKVDEDNINDNEIDSDIENDDDWVDTDNEREDDSNDEQDTKESKTYHNPGWADAMAKILLTIKPKRKKTIVLAKAKKLKPESQVEKDEALTFEVEGEINDKSKIKEETKEETKEEKKLKMRKKELYSTGRVKPTVLEKDREKVLVKIATKGVVQLFNVVRQQQKSLEKQMDEVGPAQFKRDKVLKSVSKVAFLDILGGVKSQEVPKEKEESFSEWSVLKDNFMMGNKLKDWDKDENKA